ncbi:MAG: alpha/beta hydrolase [Chloroflexia bacterium]
MSNVEQGPILFSRYTGVGDYAVVMDAGLGDNSETWALVEPQIAEFARVLVYDRAGLGRSEPTTIPRTSSNMVKELRNLLLQNEVKPPYILVGHSFGGLNMMLFASLYPDEVSGLVLIDTSHPEQVPRFLTVMTEEQSQKYIKGYTNNEEGMTFEARTQSGEEVTVALAIPAIPIIMLTAKRTISDTPNIFDVMWDEMQIDLALTICSNKLLMVQNSGHWIQRDQPDVVVNVIRELVEAARTIQT